MSQLLCLLRFATTETASACIAGTDQRFVTALVGTVVGTVMAVQHVAKTIATCGDFTQWRRKPCFVLSAPLLALFVRSCSLSRHLRVATAMAPRIRPSR